MSERERGGYPAEQRANHGDSVSERPDGLEEFEDELTTAEAGFKLRGLRWWIVGLIFLATLINYIDRLTISVLAPVITADLRLTNLQYASLGTWFLLAYTISQGISGRLYDRIGTRRGFNANSAIS